MGGTQGLSSRYSLTNIPSFYSPSSAYPVIYECSMYDQSGGLLETKSIRLAPYSSYDLIPAIFFKADLPEFGLFVAKMRPESFFTYSDRHLGDITAHFYSLYLDEVTGSLALIHPQTSLNATKWSNKVGWKSGLLIDSDNFNKILIIQINPTKESFSNSVGIYSENGIELSSINFHILSMGCHAEEVFIKDLCCDNKFIYIAAERLSSENSKPIIFLYDKKNNFSGLHF
jgi:hypothetical protein